MKILFSPCHYIFDPNSGSESSWSYSIADRIATQFPESVVVTGFEKDPNSASQNPKNYQVIQLQKGKKVVDMTLKNALLFNWLYFVKTRELLQLEKNQKEKNPKLAPDLTKNLTKNLSLTTQFQQKFQIVHHCLPFAIGSTYNLAALLGYFKNRKFVIGPLQTGLDYKDTDINPSDFRGSKAEFNLASFGMNCLATILKPVLGFLSHKTLMKADKIVVINLATKNLLLSQKIPASKIQIINPGIDLAKFKFSPKIEKNETVETFEIVSVGYLLQRKGLDLLIKAIKKLKIELENGENHREILGENKIENQMENESETETFNNLPKTQNQEKLSNLNSNSDSKTVNLAQIKIHLNILGDGPQMENLKKLVLDYELSENVTFVGFVDNSKVAKFYQNADVFVSMSRSESWGQMYLEAMACGVPIITTENVGSNEIINAKTGIIVPQESVDLLVQNLKFLIQNPAKKLEIIQNARQELELKYDWSRITEQYLKLYQQLLE